MRRSDLLIWSVIFYFKLISLSVCVCVCLGGGGGGGGGGTLL